MKLCMVSTSLSAAEMKAWSAVAETPSAAGVLREERITLADAIGRHAVVIDCRGLATATGGTFPLVPWEFSKGELIELAVEGLDLDVILNRRHWVQPVAAQRAWVGTYLPVGTPAQAHPTRRHAPQAGGALRARVQAAGRVLWGGFRDYIEDVLSGR